MKNKAIVAGIVALFFILLMMYLYVPSGGAGPRIYYYVEFKENLVFHPLGENTASTTSLTPPGYLMGIAPHSLVFAKPLSGGKAALLRIYGPNDMVSIATTTMPTFVGLQTDKYVVYGVGKTLSDMKACAIDTAGNITCAPLPSDVAMDLQALMPMGGGKVWYSGGKFYYLGKMVAWFEGRGKYGTIDENSDLLYVYALPLKDGSFILGGRTLSLYGEEGLQATATVKLPPRWISPRMVECGDYVYVSPSSTTYKFHIPELTLSATLKGVAVGCMGKTPLFFRGTYPIKGTIVSEDGKVFLNDVSFGTIVGRGDSR